MNDNEPKDFARFNDEAAAADSTQLPEPSTIISSPVPRTVADTEPQKTEAPAQFTRPEPPYGATPASDKSNNWNVDPDHPLPVAEVYSTYGMEYIIMFISLGVAAFSFGSLLNSVIDLAYKHSGNFISGLFDPYAEAALIISFPIFAFLFLRLESKEKSNPSLLTDASRRRGMQITLVASFIVGLIILSGYIGTLLSNTSAGDVLNSYSANYSADTGSSAGADFLKALVNVSIAGSIFGYYWYKLHRKTTRE
ncbi:MAG TPA: DUF5671 domain-containing protein [Candidatus Saccharimonadales bacterium]|nr:DUF5671 domain-containing protein [Candidatus Saccharimonadales bacterium]